MDSQNLPAGYRPSTSHAALGDEFYDVVAPASFPKHVLRWRNQRWAERVGLGELGEDEWIDHFGRFRPLPGTYRQPLSLRYHGHQFRVYNPEIGDGRGFLFAQLHDRVDGRLLDLGTKGSGRTPWSRTADGRLTLKGGVREILATEMLEALGVNTSKTFSLIETGEELMRGDEPSPTRSSVLVRLSHSHIRIGSFQRLLYFDRKDDIAKLLDYSISTYMPEIWRDDLAGRAVAFVENVGRLVARTGAEWMVAGFVHGVLNTDNINITGESFDYGPWRFLPVLEPGFTAAYFDHQGLYAYGRQPDTLLWNMTRLAECFCRSRNKVNWKGCLAASAGCSRPSSRKTCFAGSGSLRLRKRTPPPWRRPGGSSCMQARRPSNGPFSTGMAGWRAAPGPRPAHPPNSMQWKLSLRSAPPLPPWSLRTGTLSSIAIFRVSGHAPF